MAEIEGFKELSRQLSKMGKAAGGKALRSTVMSAALPSVRAAQSAAPVGNPPFESGGDPYPVRSYKGSLRLPGFARRNIKRKSFLSRDKRTASVRVGVAPEAFYAVQFIELGTSKITKRPWLEPSFKRSIPHINQRMKKRLKALIDKATK